MVRLRLNEQWNDYAPAIRANIPDAPAALIHLQHAAFMAGAAAILNILLLSPDESAATLLNDLRAELDLFLKKR